MTIVFVLDLFAKSKAKPQHHIHVYFILYTIRVLRAKPTAVQRFQAGKTIHGKNKKKIKNHNTYYNHVSVNAKIRGSLTEKKKLNPLYMILYIVPTA